MGCDIRQGEYASFPTHQGALQKWYTNLHVNVPPKEQLVLGEKPPNWASSIAKDAKY